MSKTFHCASVYRYHPTTLRLIEEVKPSIIVALLIRYESIIMFLFFNLVCFTLPGLQLKG